MPRSFVSVFLLVIGSGAAPACGQDMDVAGQVGEHYKKYLTRWRSCQAKAEKVTTNYVVGKKFQKREEIRQKGDWKLLLFEYDGQGSCYAKNSRYAFELRKVKDIWTLSEVDLNLANGVQIGWIATPGNMGDDFGGFCTPYTFGGHGMLPYLIKRPGFTVTKQERKAGDLVKVHFRVEPDEVSAKKVGAASVQGPGWFLLDPKSYWRLLEMELPFLGDSFIIHARYQYDMDGEFPLLNQLDMEYTSRPENKLKGQAKWTFAIEKRTPSEEEFKLSAFGLPEPTFPRRPGWWSEPFFWLVLVGIICLACAFWIRRRKRTPGPAENN
ncbi:MAG: hypothetical protein HYX68_26755 [Planctomycetes bacterium]|nr:hypothetical protein [Planctomycetota bacterium]